MTPRPPRRRMKVVFGDTASTVTFTTATIREVDTLSSRTPTSVGVGKCLHNGFPTLFARYSLSAYNLAMSPKAQVMEVEDLLTAVGNRIRDIREAKRLSPKDFAEAAGFSLAYLWRLEGGSQNLNLKSLSRISLALNVPMSAILEGIAADPDTVGTRPYRKKAGGED